MRRSVLVVCSLFLTGVLGCGDNKTQAPKDVMPAPKDGPVGAPAPGGAGGPGGGGNQPKAPKVQP
jgi:hypothetical protein